jgi:hypothetical protein
MAATIQALKRFQRAVQLHGVDQIRVVATSAMRDARNAAAFQAWVKAETGWNMEIISGLEEGPAHPSRRDGRRRTGFLRPKACGTLPAASCWSTWAAAAARSRSRSRSASRRPSASPSARCGSPASSSPPTSDRSAGGRAQPACAAGSPANCAGRTKRFSPVRVTSMIGTSGTAAAFSEACACRAKPASQARSRAANRNSRHQRRSPLARSWPKCPSRALRRARHRPAPRGNYRRRRRGFRRAAGELRASRFPLLAARLARRHSWRRCWPSRTRAPRRIASLSMSAGRACWPRRGATASIRNRPSRSAPTPCSSSAI